jgi:hypothetical protein
LALATRAPPSSIGIASAPSAVRGLIMWIT